MQNNKLFIKKPLFNLTNNSIVSVGQVYDLATILKAIIIIISSSSSSSILFGLFVLLPCTWCFRPRVAYNHALNMRTLS